MRKVHLRTTIISLLIGLLLVGCSGNGVAIPTVVPAVAKSATSIPTVDATTRGLIAQTKGALSSTRIVQSATSTVAKSAAKPTTKPTIKPTVRPTVKPTISRFDCSGTLVGGVEPKLPTITIADLYRCRPQAKGVVLAIKSNGPFEYDRDDITFENREGALPDATNGTYREYTVETPGSSTRGARRLITSGSRNRQPASYKVMYYTDDHYDTMWLVVEK